MRCIHISLLCVEDDAITRPTISNMLSMLTNDSNQLPLDKNPHFLLARKQLWQIFLRKNQKFIPWMACPFLIWMPDRRHNFYSSSYMYVRSLNHRRNKRVIKDLQKRGAKASISWDPRQKFVMKEIRILSLLFVFYKKGFI